MKIYDKDYGNTDEEYQEICDFLNELPAEPRLNLWESGRMNFWRYNVHAKKSPQDPFFNENVHLWRAEDGKIVGLCISEYGENDLFIEVMPGYGHIYPVMFAWIENTWAAGREEVEIHLFSDDAEKIAALEAHGFSFNAHVENKRIYDLEGYDLAYPLEEGFTIRTFSENPDYAGRVALVQSAFNNPNYAEANLRGLIESPDHIEEYNLMVFSPSGQPAAYCVGWHEQADEHAGYVEPVGTHADYRRRGLAKAVIKECFTRMKKNGIRTVEIASNAEPDIANYLYDSLGPKVKREVHKYCRKTEK